MIRFLYYVAVVYFRAVQVIFRGPITGDTNYLASPVLTIKRVISHDLVAAADEVVDIGCGEGVAAMVARLLTKRSVICCDVQQRFITFIRIVTRLLFITDVKCLDIDHIRATSNTVFLCVWTSWSKYNRQVMLTKLSDIIPRGARLITVSHGLIHPNFVEEAKIHERFAWGQATVYYYRHA